MGVPLFVPLVAALMLAAPLLQHLHSQIDLLRSGRVVYWGDADIVIESWGPLRYIKDAVSLLVLCIGFSAGLRSSDTFLYSVSWRWIWASVCIAVLGMLGHFHEPSLEVALAGMRWLFHVIASVGLCVYLLEKRFWSSPRATSGFAGVVLIIVVLNAVFIAVQSTLAEVPRYTGLFSTAGVMAMYLVGLVLLLDTVFLDRVWLQQLLYGLVFYSVIKSGSRSAMIIVAVMWGVSLANRLTGRQKMLLALFFPVLCFGAWYSIGFAEKAANRGGILQNQIEEGGRIANLRVFVDSLTNASATEILFGRGIGTGTNTARVLGAASGSFHPWHSLIDNGFITWFVQFGLIGLLVLVVCGLVLVGFLVRLRRDLQSCGHIAVSAIAVLLALMFVQNPFEQFGLVVCFAVSCSWMIASAAANRQKSGPVDRLAMLVAAERDKHRAG